MGEQFVADLLGVDTSAFVERVDQLARCRVDGGDAGPLVRSGELVAIFVSRDADSGGFEPQRQVFRDHDGVEAFVGEGLGHRQDPVVVALVAQRLGPPTRDRDGVVLPRARR